MAVAGQCAMKIEDEKGMHRLPPPSSPPLAPSK
jgi:hypothetical protein